MYFPRKRGTETEVPEVLEALAVLEVPEALAVLEALEFLECREVLTGQCHLFPRWQLRPCRRQRRRL